MRQTRVVVYGLLALLALSAAFCLFSFAWGTVQDMTRSRLQAQLDQTRAQQARLADLRRQRQQWQRVGDVYADFCRRYFMRRDAFSDFRRQLNDLLEANLLPNRSLTFDTTRSSAGFQKVVVHFTVSGGYANIKKLIRDIAALKRMAYLSHVEMSGVNRQVNARLQLEVFFE